MKRRKNKGNNKGMSLMELLIALAVGVIVMSALTILITQSVSQYNKLTVVTQLQEDANIALNNISDSIMEANNIVISNSKDNPTFRTGSSTIGGSDVIYRRDKDTRELKVGTSETDLESMGLLCKNVEEFKVDVVSTSFKTELVNAELDGVIKDREQVVGINNPVQIKVTIKLEYRGITREVSRVASVRNRLTMENMTLQGFRFKDAPFMEQFDDYIAYD